MKQFDQMKTGAVIYSLGTSFLHVALATIIPSILYQIRNEVDIFSDSPRFQTLLELLKENADKCSAVETSYVF